MIKLHIIKNDWQDFQAEIISADKPIGEISLKNDTEKGFYEDWFDLEIKLQDSFSEAVDEVLQAALEQAFTEIGAASVHCAVKSYDTTLNSYLNAGFSVDGKDRHITRLSITAAQYFQIKH